MAVVTVAYAGADARAASVVIEKLEKLGYTVTRSEAGPRLARRKAALASAAADPILVLWSRDYARAGAKLKNATFALRLDAAPPSPLLRAPAIDLRQWRGREDHKGWRKLVATLGQKGAPVAAAAPAKGGKPASAAKAAPAAKAEAAAAPKKKGSVGAALFWFAAAAALVLGGGAAWLLIH